MSIFRTQSEIDELELYQNLLERFAVFLHYEREWLGDRYYQKPKYIKELEESIEEDIKLNLLKKREEFWDSFEGNHFCEIRSKSWFENIYDKLSYKHPWKN